jgi:hypothetical protein
MVTKLTIIMNHKAPNRLNIEKGQRFGNLTVIEEAESKILPSRQKVRRFLCRCDCGKETIVLLLHLARGRIRSCGCLVGEKHGEAHSLLYNVWRGMKNRCYTDTYVDHHRYKDRGIAICEEWDKSYLAFKKWALENGWRHGLEIDRRNNDGNYEPSNCRFVTPVINANNRCVTFMIDYRGERKPFTEVLRERGIEPIHEAAIRGRIKRGWNPAEAIDTPIRIGDYGKNKRKP